MIVDGRGNESTVLTLSHWPDSGTPEKYRADLSATSVFHYLDDRSAGITCDTASNNHFDEDGLVSLFALLYPKLAFDYRDILIDIASAGDFGLYADRDAARISFVLSAWSTPDLSPLNQSVFARPYPEVTAILYEELLVRLPNVIEKIGNLKRYWEEEDDFLSVSIEALENGVVTVEEVEDIDMAILRVCRSDFPAKLRELGASWVSNTLHPMAIHRATDRMKVLLVKENKFELYCRYETWVDYVSRPLVKRVDLTGLAEQLSKQEPGRAYWQYTGNDEIISRLKLVGAESSAIDAESFIAAVKAALTVSPI